MDQERETNAGLRTIALIDRPEELAEVMEALASAPLVAIDTEFVRESTYYPKLCLAQLGTASLAACVDCLAPLDFGRLFGLLGDPERTWLLHSARQDLEVVLHYASVRPARLIDTQVAAALTGRPPQIGLQDLLAETLGVTLGKDFTRTDWSRRPLPDGALRYAIDDVLHLLPLWERLEQELIDLGRLDWLHEDCERLLRDGGAGDLLVIWGRLKNVQALDAQTQAAAMALVEWRETAAARLDRPRRWIMSDELLMRVAASRPATPERLAAVPEMPKRLAARSGVEIVAALETCERAEIRALLERAAPAGKPDRQALKALQERVRRRAAELGIEPEVLATRRDLAALLAERPPAHLAEGWRAEVLR